MCLRRPIRRYRGVQGSTKDSIERLACTFIIDTIFFLNSRALWAECLKTTEAVSTAISREGVTPLSRTQTTVAHLSVRETRGSSASRPGRTRAKVARVPNAHESMGSVALASVTEQALRQIISLRTPDAAGNRMGPDKILEVFGVKKMVLTISRSTLTRYLARIDAGDVTLDEPLGSKRSHEEKRLLSKDEELIVADHVRTLSAMWLSVPYATLDELVVDILSWKQETNRRLKSTRYEEYEPLTAVQERCVRNGSPCPQWKRDFIKRHGLKKMMVLPGDAVRSKVATRDVVDGHLKRLEAHLIRYGICDDDGLLVNAQALVNFDECGQFVAKSTTRDWYLTAIKSRAHTPEALDRRMFTFTCASDASGAMLRSQIIWPGKQWLDSMGVSSTMLGDRRLTMSVSENGCQTCDSLREYVGALLTDMRKVIPLEQHVVLLADNQSSRATARGALETHKMIKSQYNASWFFIPPHSSAVLQPMDRVFQTLHQKFNMHRGMLMEEGGFRRMSIAQCARMVPEVLHAFFAAVEGQGMRGAWSRCGVGPRHLDVDLVHPGDLRHDDAGAASAPPPAKRVGGTAQLVALHAILKEERKAKIARVFDVPERRGRPAGKGHVKGLNPCGVDTDEFWRRKAEIEVNERKAEEEKEAKRIEAEKVSSKRKRDAEEKAERKNKKDSISDKIITQDPDIFVPGVQELQHREAGFVERRVPRFAAQGAELKLDASHLKCVRSGVG